jgi:hypothetical protein
MKTKELTQEAKKVELLRSSVWFSTILSYRIASKGLEGE